MTIFVQGETRGRDPGGNIWLGRSKWRSQVALIQLAFSLRMCCGDRDGDVGEIIGFFVW